MTARLPAVLQEQPLLSRSQTWTRSAGSTTGLRSQTWTRSGTGLRSQTWTRRAAAVVTATLACLVPTGAALAATPAEVPTTASYVVRAVPGQLPALDQQLRRSGTVTRRLAIIDADVVRLSEAAATALRANPRVSSVTQDAAVHLASDPVLDVPGVVATLGGVDRSVGADRLWARGITGSGVDVAVIDSGIADVPGLATGHVLRGPDLSLESETSSAGLDTFGHGTHMAGIIGANGTTPGLAPGARLVAVKVADRQGQADVSQVIAGIDWVVQHANVDGNHIRVLNLSFGTSSSQSYRLDPLAYAVEQAWRAGIVVVVSAGNDSTLGHLSNPATDPYVLAVGGADTTLAAPVVASFSARGDGVRNPDLVAPGLHIASLTAPGSTVDLSFSALTGLPGGLQLGSGTSQAAAVVSGASALLLQARPGLTPDQVKALLTTSARPLTGDARAEGSGLLDVNGASTAAVPLGSTQAFPPAVGTGSLEGARGPLHVWANGNLVTGERDTRGYAVSTSALAALQADRRAWSSQNWGGQNWASQNWSSQNWSSQNWSSQNWSSQNWSSQNWSSQNWWSQNWSSQNWSSQNWSSQNWSSQNWSSQNWSSQNWSSQNWS